MITVGTIGTSWITEEFIKAAKLTNMYRLKGVYSRSIDNGKDFATVFRADYYTDQLNNLLYDPDIDVIYIASPNSLHFSQAKQAINARKHVIIEKPMVSSIDQWHELHALARRNKVFIFEAALHVHSRNYRRLKQVFVKKREEASQPFLGANLNIGQYSSRYLKYLAAMEDEKEAPNVFNLKMSGGALMDMGIYPIYVAMDLLGLPETGRYNAQYGKNGVDLGGHIYLKYPNFAVNIFVSKAVHSQLASEIYIDDETLVIQNISRISRVDLINASGEEANLISYTPESPMYDELMNFAEVMNNPNDRHIQLIYETWKQLSLQVTQTLQLLRQSADLKIDESID